LDFAASANFTEPEKNKIISTHNSDIPVSGKHFEIKRGKRTRKRCKVSESETWAERFLEVGGVDMAVQIYELLYNRGVGSVAEV